MIKRGLLSGGYLTGETQAPTALCLAPTRELAVQIHREVCKFANETVVTAAVCYGGVSVRHQADKIRRGCHFLVATPGRLIDFVDSNRVCNIHFCTNCAISLAVGNCKTVGVFPHLFFPFVFCLSMFLSSFFFKIVFFLILNVHPRSRTIITTRCFADCAKIFPIFVFNYHITCVVCCRSVWKAYVI